MLTHTARRGWYGGTIVAVRMFSYVDLRTDLHRVHSWHDRLHSGRARSTLSRKTRPANGPHRPRACGHKTQRAVECFTRRCRDDYTLLHRSFRNRSLRITIESQPDVDAEIQRVKVS